MTSSGLNRALSEAVQRHLAERIKNFYVLPQPARIFAAVSPPPGCDGRIFALGVDYDAPAVPVTEVRHDDPSTLAAAGTRYLEAHDDHRHSLVQQKKRHR